VATREGGDPATIADLWSFLGFLEVSRGNPSAALDPLRTAIEILRDAGDRLMLAEQLIWLGSVTLMVGDRDAARNHYRGALETLAAAESTINISSVLTGFAMLANYEGHHERAARLLGASARMRDDTGGGPPPELLAMIGDPESDARKALGDDAFERARAVGYALSNEEAVSYALQHGEEQGLEHP
jgi:tetratricopeptide (TPR) repeat protein